MNPPTLAPPACPEPNFHRPARLTITGFRRNGKHVVLVDSRQVMLTPMLFWVLLELARWLWSSETGFRPVPPYQTDHQYVRLQIHRLRRAIDKHTAANTGNQFIETGIGTEYRLSIPRAAIFVHPSFRELPQDAIPPDLSAFFASLAQPRE